jgi:hypothetical protein
MPKKNKKHHTPPPPAAQIVKMRFYLFHVPKKIRLSKMIM